jgi:hypothetical protein
MPFASQNAASFEGSMGRQAFHAGDYVPGRADLSRVVAQESNSNRDIQIYELAASCCGTLTDVL